MTSISLAIGLKISLAVARDSTSAIQNAPNSVPPAIAMKRFSRAEISAVSDPTLMAPMTPRSRTMGRTTRRRSPWNSAKGPGPGYARGASAGLPART